MLIDLLEYMQKLIKNGDTARAYKLQTILQSSPVNNEQQTNNSKIPLLIIGGVVIGYFWGKKRKSQELEN